MYLICHHCGIPDPRRDRRIKVYYPQAFLRTYKRRNQQKVFETINRHRIEMEEIVASPQRFVMFRPTMLDQDFGGELPEGSCCIYSYWPGYLEQPRSANVERKVTSAGARFVKAHTSGHMFAEDTAAFLGEMDPKVVIPIHTFNPEAFRRLGRKVRTLNDGEPYEVP